MCEIATFGDFHHFHRGGPRVVKGLCAVQNGSWMAKTRSMAVWLGETLSEAVSTTLLMTVLAFVEAERPIHNDLSFLSFAGVSAVVFIEFAITGYLVTTAIAALLLPQRGKYLYPATCFFLYLLHSEIFFVGAGNPWFDKSPAGAAAVLPPLDL